MQTLIRLAARLYLATSKLNSPGRPKVWRQFAHFSPNLFLVSRDTPACTKSRTTCKCPCLAACIRGVHPRLFVASRSAFWDRRKATIDSWSFAAAIWREVLLSWSRESTARPVKIRSCRICLYCPVLNPNWREDWRSRRLHYEYRSLTVSLRANIKYYTNLSKQACSFKKFCKVSSICNIPVITFTES